MSTGVFRQRWKWRSTKLPWIGTAVEATVVVLNAAMLSANAQSVSAYCIVMLRPISDASLGNWVDNNGGSVDIYSSIDEVSADDNDYIKSPNNPSANIYKCKITSAFDPNIHVGHKVGYRYRKPDNIGTVNLKVRLVEGTTTRREWTHNNIGTSWVTEVQTLTEGEASAIVDYTDLYLEFEATAV